MINSNRHSYNGLSKCIHWLMGGMFIYVLTLGLVVESMARGPEKMAWLMQHKSLGALLGFLAVLRLLWRFVSATPGLPSRMPKWQKITARLNLVVLYGAMFGLPLSGCLMSMAGGHPVVMLGVELPMVVDPNKALAGQLRWLHGVLGTVTLVALVLHILGALHHHMIAGDDVLYRMLPGNRRRQGNTASGSCCQHSNTKAFLKLDDMEETYDFLTRKARLASSTSSPRAASPATEGASIALAAASSSSSSSAGGSSGACSAASSDSSSSSVSCDSM